MNKERRAIQLTLVELSAQRNIWSVEKSITYKKKITK